MKKKGFTLVELLVVIAIIAMLLAILMPALGKVKQLAQRVICSTNIGGIGKAMLAYATDDKYESYPVAGPINITKWDYGSSEGECTWKWHKKAVPGTTDNPAGLSPTSTISACLYLLVKFADVSPEQFVCPGSEEKKFQLRLYTIPTSAEYGQGFTEVWDFGSKDDEESSGKRGLGHCSYSYHLPLSPKTLNANAYPMSGTSNPAMAIIADRSPYWDYTLVEPGNVALYGWDEASCTIDPDTIEKGNNAYHQKEGQNVLFVDQHVRFEKSANCGLEMDNIYTTWEVSSGDLPTGDICVANGKAQVRQCGGSTTMPGTDAGATVTNYPLDRKDNFLVSDYTGE